MTFSEMQDGSPTPIVAQDLSIVRGQFVALDSVNFSLEIGVLSALVGPSGCGKSSLLRVLSLLDRPTKGSVLYWGRSIVGGEAKQFVFPRISYVPQTLALWPHMTLGENMLFSTNGSTEARSRLSLICKELEICELLKRKPKDASLGQCQRVAIARALVLNPEVLLLDEATSALDQRLAVKVWKLFRQFVDKGGTILASTHDRELMNECDKVLTISNGNLSEINVEYK